MNYFVCLLMSSLLVSNADFMVYWSRLAQRRSTCSLRAPDDRKRDQRNSSHSQWRDCKPPKICHLKIEKFCSKLFNSLARRSSRVDRQHFACRSLCRSRAIQDRSCRSNRHCDQRFWPANVQREYQRAGRFGRRQSLLCRAENSCTSARQSRGTVSGIEARF